MILQLKTVPTLGTFADRSEVFGFGQVSAKPNKRSPRLGELQLLTRLKSAFTLAKCIGIKVAKAIR